MVETQEQLPACFDCKHGTRDFPCRDSEGKLCADRLVDSLLFTLREDVGSTRYEENCWASECVDTIVGKAPETAFRLILLALAQCRTDSEIGRLAAGPLENLVFFHGGRMIEAIEREASENERFRFLLSGIWGESDVDPEIWRRIQAAVRKGPWLDEDHRTPQGSKKDGSGK